MKYMQFALFAVLTLSGACGVASDMKDNVDTMVTRAELNSRYCQKQLLCLSDMTGEEAEKECADNDFFYLDRCQAETFEVIACLDTFGTCGANGFGIDAASEGGICHDLQDAEFSCLRRTQVQQ